MFIRKKNNNNKTRVYFRTISVKRGVNHILKQTNNRNISGVREGAYWGAN